jgi:putative PIN family toxin of toxin-antitoxin system
MPPRVVIDTSVFVAALISARGTNRRVLRLAFEGHCIPLMSAALLAEYEALLSRKEPFLRSPISASEREALFDSLVSVSQWMPIYFRWRPNLRDEGDNHVLELAVAGNAGVVITNNVRDFASGELRFPRIQVLTPGRFCGLF